MTDSGLLIKAEFALPWGVCDFVGVKLDPQKVRRRLVHCQTRPIGSNVRICILAKIPDFESGKSIRLETLAKHFAPELSSDVVSKEIRALIGGNFVRSFRKGLFQKINRWAPLHQRIVAIESKLTRLPDAIKQAAANRSFATESYVALPDTIAVKVAGDNRAKMFRERGIGLLAVFGYHCSELIKPSNNVVHNEILQTAVTERFWRTRGNSP